MKLRSFLLLTLLSLLFIQANAQFGFGLGDGNIEPEAQEEESLGAEDLTAWSIKVSDSAPCEGDEITITIETEIDPKWYIYSSDFDENCGPTLTTVDFSDSKNITLIGDLKSPGASEKYDDIFECTYGYFKKKATFIQKAKVTGKNVKIRGERNYQICTIESGLCIPGEGSFELEIETKKDCETTGKTTTPKITIASSPPSEEDEPNNSTKESADSTTISANKTPIVPKKDANQFSSANLDCHLNAKGWDHLEVNRFDKQQVEQLDLSEYLIFMLIAFLSGLAALLTPCVFPMIPMTVTFFTKSSGSKTKAISQALFYGISIILIYVLFGTIVASINGPGFANWLSTNWIPNVLFFIIFMIFAFSFLGMFEITLPSNFVNKVDAQADKGGLVGVFFMAFTLVLVSFSCTGPIVGSILVEAAGGQVLKPILGMFAFSLSFAIPFTLFAIFPSWLQGLPKSGGWLNSVKVILGFLELALAFKFLSVADQAYHWNLLDREVFLAIWIAVFTGLALYLLGKITLPHDSPLEKLPIPRLLLAVVTLTFVVYMIPGMFGAPLKALSGLLPPMTTQDFVLENGTQKQESSKLCFEPSHKNELHLPHGLNGYYDLNEAICCAKEQDKPIFIDFTGHGCVNCRKMEEYVWSDPRVLKKLSENYVIAALYVDDKVIQLPKNKVYTNESGKEINTIGELNFDLELNKFKQQAQPYYVLLGVDEEESTSELTVLNELNSPVSYDNNIEHFLEFLDKGIENHNKKK